MNVFQYVRVRCSNFHKLISDTQNVLYSLARAGEKEIVGREDGLQY